MVRKDIPGNDKALILASLTRLTKEDGGWGGGEHIQHTLSIKLKLFHMLCYLKLRQKFKNNNKTTPVLGLSLTPGPGGQREQGFWVE